MSSSTTTTAKPRARRATPKAASEPNPIAADTLLEATPAPKKRGRPRKIPIADVDVSTSEPVVANATPAKKRAAKSAATSTLEKVTKTKTTTTTRKTKAAAAKEKEATAIEVPIVKAKLPQEKAAETGNSEAVSAATEAVKSAPLADVTEAKQAEARTLQLGDIMKEMMKIDALIIEARATTSLSGASATASITSRPVIEEIAQEKIVKSSALTEELTQEAQTLPSSPAPAAAITTAPTSAPPPEPRPQSIEPSTSPILSTLASTTNKPSTQHFTTSSNAAKSHQKPKQAPASILSAPTLSSPRFPEARAAFTTSKPASEPVAPKPRLPQASNPGAPSTTLSPASQPRSQPTPGAGPDIRQTKEYKAASKRWTSTIVAIPVLLVTSWVLYQRLALGQDKRVPPKPKSDQQHQSHHTLLAEPPKGHLVEGRSEPKTED